MKHLKVVVVAAIAASTLSLSMSAAAASFGPRAHVVGARAAVAAPAKQAKALHAAGPRNTIAVFDDRATQLAAVVDVEGCEGHRAGPRATMCL